MASLFLLFFFFAFHFHQNTAQQSILQTYIIHVKLPEGSHDFPPALLESWYGSFLDGMQFLETKTTPSRMVYTYRNVITGFAAKLYPHEVKEMEKKQGFLHATLEEKYALHTTSSPNFLGLYQNNVGALPAASNYGKGVIIGVVDTGITPGHPSFSGENVPPPPAKWKGKCELKSVSCNNKIIGARNFARDDPGEPLDNDGHGTHMASIAAGNFVPGAASGMAPLAHLSIYKACRKQDCYSSDILAAMDAAIEDGVDILSLSFGITKNVQFYEDVIALGAFSAMKKGIFASSQLSNGASTIDRKLDARILLGNEDEYDAQTLLQPKDYQPSFKSLIYPGNISGDKKSIRKLASRCLPGSLDDIDVTGKLVVCDVGFIDYSAKARVVGDAGGAGMILVNGKLRGYTTFAEDQALPAVQVGHATGQSIKSYINTTFSPIAILLFS